MQNLLENVYNERKKKNLTIIQVHNFVLGTETWDIFRPLIDFVSSFSKNSGILENHTSENTTIQSENAHLPRQVKTSGIRICSWLAVILNVHSCPCCTAANCRNSWIYFFILWNANFVQCIKFCSTRFYQTRFRVHFCHARLAQQLMFGLRLVTFPNRK